MPREADPSTNERRFILQALNHGVRVDGRPLDRFRDIVLSFGREYGSAEIQLGKTRVYVQVSAEVAKPLDDRKFDGIFTITTELGPIASPAFEVGRQTDQEVILSRILEKAIRRSNAIDTESLCIIAGLKCWSVRADVHVLNADGNLIDASCLAILAALQHFRRPDVSVDGEDVTIYTIEERVPVPLSIMHHPICITFSFYHDGQIFILDASLREEQVREGEVIVTVNQYGEVCQIAKLGGVSVEPMTMLQIVSIAESKAKEIDQIISKGLLQDSVGRNVEGLIAELSAENER